MRLTSSEKELMNAGALSKYQHYVHIKRDRAASENGKFFWWNRIANNIKEEVEQCLRQSKDCGRILSKQ